MKLKMQTDDILYCTYIQLIKKYVIHLSSPRSFPSFLSFTPFHISSPSILSIFPLLRSFPSFLSFNSFHISCPSISSIFPLLQSFSYFLSFNPFHLSFPSILSVFPLLQSFPFFLSFGPFHFFSPLVLSIFSSLFYIWMSSLLHSGCILQKILQISQ